MRETQRNSALPTEALRHQLLHERQRLEHELGQLTSEDEAVATTDSLLNSRGMVSDQADDADARSGRT